MDENDYTGLFQGLFEEHFRTVFLRAASFVRDPDVAKDLAHDVFSSVWEHRKTIDFQEPIAPYLSRLIHNRCLNYLRRQRTEQHFRNLQNASPEEEPFGSVAEEGELVYAIIRRIDSLPPRCSEVMRRCFLENKKYKEVASELNISVNTVKEHVSRGLQLLRTDFPRTGFSEEI